MVFLTNDFPDLTGKVIAGRYFLEELVGTGGFGVVHRATDTDRREYAVKCLRRVAKQNSRDAIRQIREMALHRMVSSHPNIVTIHEVVEDDEFVYVVMDFCPGGDLFGAIIEQEVFYDRDDLIKSVFLQIVDAVHSCHERGIAHRDLKPENILCNEDYSQVYLADFGLSSRDSYSEEFCCGSSYYMSPECIGLECGWIPYSPVYSDVWSLGVILVNMVTRRNPWNKATTQDDCFNNYVHDPDSLFSMLPISVETHHILKRTLALKPRARMTLPELREAILKVKTFFPDDDRVAQPFLIPEDSSFATPVPVLRVVNCRTMECVDSSNKGAPHTISSSPMVHYLFPTPDPNKAKPTAPPPISFVPIPQLFRSSSSSDSEEDSEGVVTPPADHITHSHDIAPFEKSFGLHASPLITPWRPYSKAKQVIVRHCSAPIKVNHAKLLLSEKVF